MATTLITHTTIAIVLTNLFLSQMAMLEASMNASFGERWSLLRRTEGDVHAQNDQEGSGDKA
jgi:hypothetical protein